MIHFGKIKSYDSGKGSGLIAPESGGEPLSFVKADLQQEAAEPMSGQRYGYETSQVDGGKSPRATNLQPDDGQSEQADKQQG